MPEWVIRLLDFALLIVLGATIIYASILQRALARLRDAKSELVPLIRTLAESIQRAETATRALGGAAGEGQQAIEHKLAEGRALRDELSLVIETATALADRIERSGSEVARASAGRSRPASASMTGEESVARPAASSSVAAAAENAARATGAAGGGRPRSKAEQELFEAIEILRRGAS